MAYDPWIVGSLGDYDDAETHAAKRAANAKAWTSLPISKWATLHAVIGGAFAYGLSVVAPALVPFLVGVALVMLAHVAHALRATRFTSSQMDSHLMDVSRTLTMVQSQYPLLRDGSNIRDELDALRMRIP